MTQQDKERIEKEADALLLKYPADSALQEGRKKFYIAGATAEHERLKDTAKKYPMFEELLKQERNKAIDEAKELFNDEPVTQFWRWQIQQRLESLKH